MRVLAVIGGELIGADERRDWAVLNVLLAANSPAALEVRVLALVGHPRTSIAVGHPLGRAVGHRPRSGGHSGGYDPGESARGRLDRALQHLRGLGLRASGDIEAGDAYRAVRREVAAGSYDRVLVLVHPSRSWSGRFRDRSLGGRLRRRLDVPVDTPLGRRPPELCPPR